MANEKQNIENNKCTCGAELKRGELLQNGTYSLYDIAANPHDTELHQNVYCSNDDCGKSFVAVYKVNLQTFLPFNTENA
jgi:hypothetical protein